MKSPDISNIIDRGYALGVKETKKKILPIDAECEKWYSENIDESIATVSSSIHKFRLWLKNRST